MTQGTVNNFMASEKIKLNVIPNSDGWHTFFIQVHSNNLMMVDEIEEKNIIPLKIAWKKKEQPGKTDFSVYTNIELKKQSEKINSPDQQQEFTVDKWTSPVEPQGYIKGRDNDCL
jgi:predicted DNA-binding protein (MmcQ/YjbR family)